MINILSNLTMMAGSPQSPEWRQEAEGLQGDVGKAKSGVYGIDLSADEEHLRR